MMGVQTQIIYHTFSTEPNTCHVLAVNRNTLYEIAKAIGIAYIVGPTVAILMIIEVALVVLKKWASAVMVLILLIILVPIASAVHDVQNACPAASVIVGSKGEVKGLTIR